MAWQQAIFGDRGAPAVLVGFLFNGAVAAAIATGLFQYFMSQEDHRRKLETSTVLEILKFDRTANSNVVSTLRMAKELDLLDEDMRTKWSSHVENNTDVLPRFYHSGFVWSIFHPHVRTIKLAYQELQVFDGTIDDKVDAAFVLATMRMQRMACMDEVIYKAGHHADCMKYADGLLGKKTLHEIALIYELRTGKKLKLQ